VRKRFRVVLFFAFLLIFQVGTRGAERTIRVMCVGDSITAGYTDNPSWSVPYCAAYRMALYSMMTNAGYGIQFVGDSPEPWNGVYGLPKFVVEPDLRDLDQDHHHGYGWMDANGIRTNLDQWITAGSPDVILLMVGNISFQFRHSAEQTGNELEEVVKLLQTSWPKIHLIVAEMTPSRWFQPEVVAYNEFIRKVLVPRYTSQGMRISTVDQYINLLIPGGTVKDIDPTVFSNGSHHLYASGYEKVARTWFEGIQRIFPRTPVKVVTAGRISSEGHFQATYSGSPNAIYQIERATELDGKWVKIGAAVVADSEGIFLLDDPEPLGFQSFYRMADPYK
jgi:hypothetical protein